MLCQIWMMEVCVCVVIQTKLRNVHEWWWHTVFQAPFWKGWKSTPEAPCEPQERWAFRGLGFSGSGSLDSKRRGRRTRQERNSPGHHMDWHGPPVTTLWHAMRWPWRSHSSQGTPTAKSSTEQEKEIWLTGWYSTFWFSGSTCTSCWEGTMVSYPAKLGSQVWGRTRHNEHSEKTSLDFYGILHSITAKRVWQHRNIIEAIFFEK